MARATIDSWRNNIVLSNIGNVGKAACRNER
jgi:hypothetical protein